MNIALKVDLEKILLTNIWQLLVKDEIYKIKG